VRLRASQSRDDVIRFEKELTCERLRLQVLRLRESLGIEGDGQQAKAVQETPGPNAEAERQRLEREAIKVESTPAIKVEPTPASQAQACKRDEEKLQRLRSSQVREEVIRFEKELVCERLRLQVLRLKESVGAN
jgi:hypothetical protein